MTRRASRIHSYFSLQPAPVRPSRRPQGFTIVELLIVVVVIAILAAITIVAYTGIQSQARDSQRLQDMATIKKAIMMYDTENGGAPLVSSYNAAGGTHAGWDASVDANWLAFLRDKHGPMPVDPVNELTSPTANPSSVGQKAYFYYCYATPEPRVRYGYHKDNGDFWAEYIPVESCITL